MYAIFVDGGRQYKVEAGQEVVLDYRDVRQGEQLTFDSDLAVSGDEGIKIGTPNVSCASITAEVLGPLKGEKLVVQKMRRRKNYRRRTGHRQWHTRVKISGINV